VVTVNDLEQHSRHFFALFNELGSFGGHYITVVEVRPLLSATNVLLKESVFGSIWFMVISSCNCGERMS